MRAIAAHVGSRQRAPRRQRHAAAARRVDQRMVVSHNEDAPETARFKNFFAFFMPRLRLPPQIYPPFQTPTPSHPI